MRTRLLVTLTASALAALALAGCAAMSTAAEPEVAPSTPAVTTSPSPTAYGDDSYRMTGVAPDDHGVDPTPDDHGSGGHGADD